jgi:hypothetical protein
VTARNSLFVNNLLSVEDSRLGVGALWTPGSTSVTAMTGFRPGPADPGVVTASTTADANVHVAPFQLVLQSHRGTVSGAYTATLDASLTINILSTPANGTNPRNDLIIAQQTDTFYGDGTSAFVVKQVVGTPAASPSDPAVTGSTDFVIIARVRVPANATTIITSNITDLRPAQLFTVAVGGVIPTASQATRDALPGKYDGMVIYRQDHNWFEVYDGAAFRVQGVPVVSSFAGLSAITSPTTGQIAVVTSNFLIYQYSGSAWVSGTGWIDYSGSFTWTNTVNPTIGNGALVAHYMQIAGITAFRFSITAGSTTAWGSGGGWSFGIFGASVGATGQAVGVATLQDSSVSVNRLIRGLYLNSSSSVAMSAEDGTRVSPTTPFTFANGDQITGVGIYE